MRKIFTIFAAMLLTLAVNATTTWNITNEKSDTLLNVILGANGGDTIVMAEGTYAEGLIANNFYIDKSLVIKAATDANVTIQPQLPMLIRKGSRVEFIGIKFDATNLRKRVTWPSNVIRPYDTSSGNKLILEGCEFVNDTINNAIIYCSSDYKLDSCIVNNCKIRGIKKSFIFLENTDLIGLIVTNSTFSNISTASSFSAGIIDPRATSAKVRIDQCTFYDCLPNASDRGIIRVANTTDVVVSNCIFTMPTSTEVRAICIKGGDIKNCLLKNFSKGTHGIHTDSPWAPTITDCASLYEVDPLFTNAATGDFSLPDNSPCKAAGVGGTHLGDKRWWHESWTAAAEVEVSDIELDADELTLDVYETAFLHATVSPDNATDPSVTWTSSDPAVATVINGAVKALKAGTTTITATAGAFSDVCSVTVSSAIPSTNFASAYFLEGTKAKLEGNIYVSETDSLYYVGQKETTGTATWYLHATTTGLLNATVNFKTTNTSGSKFNLKIYDSEDDLVGEDSLAYWDEGGDKLMTGTLCIPVEGDYTIVLSNKQEWSSTKIKGITLTKASALPTVAAKGDWDSWAAEAPFALAKDGKTASLTKSFTAGSTTQFKVLINGELRSNTWYYKPYENTGASNITTNEYNNMAVCALYTGDHTITWTFANNAIEVTFPEVTIYFANENDWTTVKAYAWKDGTEVKNATWSGEVIDTPTGLKYKGHDIYAFTTSMYDRVIFNDGTNQTGNIIIDPANPYYYAGACHETWDETPTSIDNTVVGEKAVKFFENGQLFIQKDGKTYNILGTIVK